MNLSFKKNEDHSFVESVSSAKITCLSPCGVEKRTTILVCEANGNPKVEYVWSYGQNSPFNTYEESKHIIRGNRLIINQVDQTDNGRYICHAFNDYDKIGQKVEFMLNIISKTKMKFSFERK